MDSTPLSLERSTPIAYGRTAEIYPWPGDRILKLYFDWCPPNWVEYESRIAHAVITAGIPAPRAEDIVEIKGRRGLVYERIEGVSMLVDLNSHPWRLVQYANLLADLQWRIHQLKIPGLPSSHEELSSAIQKTDHLPDPLRERVLAALKNLPEGDAVCHGDFHPHNVLMTSRGPLVIDWMTASTGNPWADVARTSILITIGARGAGKMVSRWVSFGLGLYHQLYLRHYRALSPDKEGLFQRFRPVLAAARINEDIVPEREYLLQFVRSAFD